MPVIEINAIDGVATGSGRAGLSTALRDLSPGAPVIVLVHGYKYSPRLPASDPHQLLYALKPLRGGRTLSWPRHLGFGRGDAREGLCIAFGWHARDTIWHAAGAARAAGATLADVIAEVRQHHRGPVDLFAHSLGARVALSGLHHLRAGDIGRMILLSGAEFRAQARNAVGTSAGRHAEIVNIISRENDLFDLLFERLLQPPTRFDTAIGTGLPDAPDGWHDLRIDDDATRSALKSLGFRIPPPKRTFCHWSGYMRPGLFALYTAILRDRLCLRTLSAALPAPAPQRAPRLIPREMPPLPLLRNASS
ncbi:MAG: alpha/beta hydrolase [Pseudomonadota bacterium]